VLATHPLAIIGTEIYENFYYVPPEEYLGNDPEGSVLLRSIGNLAKYKQNKMEMNEALEKLRLLNEMLGVVGKLTRHDVGNKLMVIQSNSYMLKKKVGDNPELQKYFDGINSSIDLSKKLFEFSRIYEKIGSEQLMKVDVGECLDLAVSLLPKLQNINFFNACHGFEVVADSLLRQLFYNLVDNSLKHGGKVTQIGLRYAKEDNQARLFYEDNGVGIPVENKLKIFDEGFTTGKSTGLGLFLIKRIVEVYGWTITEDGKPGKGVKFAITIPASKVSRPNKRADA
jgi:signal transduction histidine kinase